VFQSGVGGWIGSGVAGRGARGDFEINSRSAAACSSVAGGAGACADVITGSRNRAARMFLYCGQGIIKLPDCGSHWADYILTIRKEDGPMQKEAEVFVSI
jgi:hypothetical protein